MSLMDTSTTPLKRMKAEGELGDSNFLVLKKIKIQKYNNHSFKKLHFKRTFEMGFTTRSKTSFYYSRGEQSSKSLPLP